MPHPATMFFLLTLGVIFLSWIFDGYGLSVRLPHTGEEIRVQSLLSPEGIRWLLRHVVTNFTGFAPLGLVIVAMFGIGVAQHSGFIDACIRKGIRGRVRNPWRIILSVIVLGLLSNVVGDAGYIILLPIAATLFHSVGLHPIGGIIAAYVSVSCGYSANILLSTLDPMLAATTQEAADMTDVLGGRIGPLCNYYFFCVSTFLLVFIIYHITCRKLLPGLGEYNGSNTFCGYKQLSRKEQRALWGAVIVGLLYAAFVLWATFSSWGILRGVNGGLTRSPFIIGILFLLSLGIGLMGMVYGFVSGRYRTDSDVIEGLTQPMRLLGVYFVIAFFASQMFACFEYSHLDKCIAIMGANVLSPVRSDSLWILILFILFTALINLIMVSSTSKWAFMSFIFVPVLAGMGISPDMALCAYRIGDSATNAITPFFASQMFACFEYSHLDKCIAIMGANVLSPVRSDSLWILILFILFTALINLIMVSSTSKWAFMSFIFVPVLAGMGISPDMALCAYRIGDSATNAITPFMFYMPLVLTYMQQYDKQSTYGSLLKYTWRYSLVILIAWTALFVLWYLCKLPLGL